MTKSRQKAELLTEEEAVRFIELVKKNKIKRSEIARMIGLRFKNSVSPWFKRGAIPASCRAYLQLLELKESIKKMVNKSTN